MASIKNMLLDDDEDYSIPDGDELSFTNEQELRAQEEPQFSPDEVKLSQIQTISSPLSKSQPKKSEESNISVEMTKDVKLNRMSMIEEEFEECLDESGGIQEVASVLKLIEFMKEEKNAKERIYLLEILSNTCHTAALSRFVQLEGVQILADWVRELTPDSVGWKDESDKEVLSICLNALNSLPMSKTVLKATLIGKAVHKLEQSPIGDQKGIKSKSRSIVSKWRELTHKQKNLENKLDSTSYQDSSLESNSKTMEDDLSEVQSKGSTIMALLAQTDSSDKVGGLKRPRFDDDDPFEIAHMPEKRRRLDMDLQGNIAEMEIYESRGPKTRMSGGVLKVVGEQNRRKKQVKFRPNDDIESVKVFKMNDEPNARSLTREEIQMLQESLANVPAHRIPAELKIMEMKFDKRRMSERKETEDRLQKKLEDMRPLVKWPSFLKKVSADGHNVARAEESQEVKAQKLRERTVMGVSYMKPQHIPLNPVVEMDEIYGNKKEVMDAIIKKDLEMVVRQKREKEEEEKKQKEQKLTVGALIGKLVRVIEKIESGILSSEAAAMVGGNEANYNLINLITKFAESKNQGMGGFQKQIGAQTLPFQQPQISQNQQFNSLGIFQQRPSLNPQNAMNTQQNNFQNQQQQQQQLLQHKKFKTVPCRLFHGPQGCTRGEHCHFIHANGYGGQDMPRDVFMRIRNENMRLQAVGLPPNDDGPTEESEKSIRLAQATQQQQQPCQGISASNGGQIGMLKIPTMGMQMQRSMGIPSNIGAMSQTRPNQPQSFPGMFNGQKSLGEKNDEPHVIPPQMMMSILQKNQQPPNGQIRMPNQFNAPIQQRPPMMGQMNQMQMGMNPMMQPGFRPPQQMGIRYPPSMMPRFPGPPPKLVQQWIGGQSNGVETIEDNDQE